MDQATEKAHVTNFIKNIINEDIQSQKHAGKVTTRFPPEPNGYLHIGHAKSICLNFGLAKDYPDAKCHLRFDDTNPCKEDQEYIRSIKEDVQWLGFSWGQNLFHASDYFEALYGYAIELIKKGLAYVCSLSGEDIRAYRGTLTESGKESPYRNSRSIEENLALFEQMKNGAFPDGTHVLRAKIDMNSGNINMRDPIIYRIRHAHHPMTGDKWCIYPMYDFTHCISDALEHITHSICTLEFEDHRPLYDWFLDHLSVPSHPHQYEFARLEMNYTVTSKRKLKELVDSKKVDGWDDPRLPTIAGMRRRGYTPASIRKFCDIIGVSKKQTTIDMDILEEAVREDLNQNAKRAMCVLRPLKVVITNYNEADSLLLEMNYHHEDDRLGKRQVPFGRELYIEQADFMENPPKDFFRLSVGKEVRLRHSYIIRCDEVIKDASGQAIELRCSYDSNTLGKKPEGRKVKGIIHWVSAKHAVDGIAHIYERLFTVPMPSAEEKNGKDFKEFLNPKSLQVLEGIKLEPSLASCTCDDRFQFERVGYFCKDAKQSEIKNALVFNQIVGLKVTFQSS